MAKSVGVKYVHAFHTAVVKVWLCQKSDNRFVFNAAINGVNSRLMIARL